MDKYASLSVRYLQNTESDMYTYETQEEVRGGRRRAADVGGRGKVRAIVQAAYSTSGWWGGRKVRARVKVRRRLGVVQVQGEDVLQLRMGNIERERFVVVTKHLRDDPPNRGIKCLCFVSLLPSTPNSILFLFPSFPFPSLPLR